MIDWSNPASEVTDHFNAGELTWLPTWQQHATPSEAEQANLERVAHLLEIVRAYLGDKAINIHVAIRPAAYNAQIGGAPNSAHIHGLAADFDVQDMHCDDVRAALEPMLEQWGARMERKPGSDWVHLDLADVPPGGHRYFIP